MEDLSFENFWELFSPDAEFGNRRAATNLQWNKCSEAKKKAIIAWLTEHKPKSSRNPYFFVQDFREPRLETLSFDEYYKRKGTTEERDGWKMANPTGNKVIYVKPA